MNMEPTLTSGKDAFRAMRQEILDSKPEILRLITAFDTFKQCFPVEERIGFTNDRKAAGIDARVIFSSSSPDVESKPLPEDYVWFLHATLPVSVDIYIYNDTVVTVDMSNLDEPQILTIRSQAYATSMRALFDRIWQEQSSVV